MAEQIDDEPLPNGSAHRHLSARAEEIEEGGKVFSRNMAPDRFPQLLALVCLVIAALACGGAMYSITLGAAADRRAFTEAFDRNTNAIDRNTTAIGSLSTAVSTHEVAATARAAGVADGKRGRGQ
jgi:hypothetical protein